MFFEGWLKENTFVKKRFMLTQKRPVNESIIKVILYAWFMYSVLNTTRSILIRLKLLFSEKSNSADHILRISFSRRERIVIEHDSDSRDSTI